MLLVEYNVDDLLSETAVTEDSLVLSYMERLTINGSVREQSNIFHGKPSKQLLSFKVKVESLLTKYNIEYEEVTAPSHQGFILNIQSDEKQVITPVAGLFSASRCVVLSRGVDYNTGCPNEKDKYVDDLLAPYLLHVEQAAGRGDNWHRGSIVVVVSSKDSKPLTKDVWCCEKAGILARIYTKLRMAGYSAEMEHNTEAPIVTLTLKW